jgi:hypothetical protein
MNPHLSGVKLMPLIQKQKYGEELLVKFLNSADYKKRTLLTQAAKLQERPVLKTFHWPISSQTKNRSKIFHGHATAIETVLERTGFRDKEIRLEMTKVMDFAGRWEFIMQSNEERGHLVSCSISNKLRRQGLFKKMVAAITAYAFNELKLKSVTGRAAPPINEPTQDWRTEEITYRKNFQTGEEIKTTRLHLIWLRQPYALHSRMIGEEDDAGFALLNPKHLLTLPIEEIAELDKFHPKQKKDSFVSLLERRSK